MRLTRTIRFYAPEDMPEANAVHGFGLTQDFAPHVHTAYVLGLCENGQRTITFARQRYEITPGELFLISPKTAHRCRCTAAHSYRIVCFSPALLQQNVCFMPLIRDPELAGLLLNFHQAIETQIPLPHRRELLANLLHVLRMRHTSPADTVPEDERDAIQWVLAHIHNHFAEKLTLQTFSAATGLSPCHLQRIFSSKVGVSPQAYLARHRVRRAAGMLQQGRAHTETALGCGFTDQSHLIRVFKRYAGLSPDRYLQQNKGKGLP